MRPMEPARAPDRSPEGDHAGRLGRRSGPRLVPVRGRLASISVRAASAGGFTAGAIMGLLAGVLLGAFLTWAAGALLDWQRDVAYTIGVTTTLLPFGAQIPLLRSISDDWYLVVPAVGAGGAALGGIFGALLGALLATLYRLLRRHAQLVIELPVEGSGAPAGETGPSGR